MTAYALAFGSLLLLGGRLGDLFGRKWTFIGGLVGFSIASGIGGAAGSFPMLVGARAAQGAFGAILAPSALALLTTTFENIDERRKAFGVFGAISGAGAAFGLFIGGVLTQEFSWRLTLFVNLAIALPAALAGIAWFLFITHTTLSVPALMGAIMCMGVATSNSILVVSFATEQMEAGKDSISAALEAGFTRFRPVLMTALAMIIGMVPMALGLGDGGEQNAPLGRAVIGGLIFATVSTLFFVPAFFSLLQQSNRNLARK